MIKVITGKVLKFFPDPENREDYLKYKILDNLALRKIVQKYMKNGKLLFATDAKDLETNTLPQEKEDLMYDYALDCMDKMVVGWSAAADDDGEKPLKFDHKYIRMLDSTIINSFLVRVIYETDEGKKVKEKLDKKGNVEKELKN